MLRIVFLVIVIALAVWRVYRGFHCGLLQEVAAALSVAAGCICILLLALTVGSVWQRAASLLVVCLVGLLIVGIAYKICRLIFRPILALRNVAVISGLDKLAGSVLGLAEAAVVGIALYRVLAMLGYAI